MFRAEVSGTDRFIETGGTAALEATLIAPTASAVFINGTPADFTRSGDSITVISID